jgi:hypothetical protein
MRRRWLLGTSVALAMIAASACSGSAGPTLGSGSSSTASHGEADGPVLVSLAGWATLRVPRRWHVTAFRGEPAAAYIPLDFVSTEQLSRVCPGKITQSCAAENWFAPGWTAPEGGFLVLWAHAELPSGPALAHVSGHRATIDGRPAKVWSGSATSACPPDTATEVAASISTSDLSGERLDMTACFGPHASSDDHASVLAMLNSLHRRYRT